MYCSTEFNIFLKFKKIFLDLHKFTKYFDNELCLNFITANNLNLIRSCKSEFNEKINHIKFFTDVFNPDEIINILNVLINYCDVKDVRDYITALFSCESLYNGLCTKTSIFGFSGSCVNHYSINLILNFFEINYHLTEKVMCSIRIKIIINMYKYIIAENNRKTMYFDKYLFDNVGCVLFQMDKFWNSVEVNQLLKKEFKEKEKILKIQYLSSECRLMTSQNKNYKFENLYVEYDLELENCIFNYLHSN